MAFWNRKKPEDTRNGLNESVSVNLSRSLDSRNAFPAMENSAFWTCVTKLCRQYGTMPWHLYERLENGSRRKIYNTPVNYLLAHPCSFMDSYQWRFVMGFNFELHGIAMAIIERKGKTITNLFPVSPRLMTPKFSEAGELGWTYSPTQQWIADRDVLRIMNTPVSYGEVLSPVSYSTDDVEVAKSSQKLQKSFFRHGASVGALVTVPRGTPESVKVQLRDVISSAYSGLDNAHKTMVLEESIKYEPIALQDGDLTKLQEAQSWTVAEVARRFGVPPFFCGDLSKATYANSEQQGLDLVIYALRPRFCAWEEALANVLCEDGQYIKYNFRALLSGDHAARANFYNAGIQNGWLTRNEVREWEDLDPCEGGDSFFFPLNFGKVGKDGSIEIPVQESAPEKREPMRESFDYLTEAKGVSKSNRQKVESVMRSQVKDFIGGLKDIVTEGKAVLTIAEEFRAFVESVQADYGQKYVELLTPMADKLEKLIRKQTGKTKEINADAVASYIGKLGQSISTRLSADCVHGVENLGSADELEDLESSWVEAPVSQASEETQRVSNACQVFLFEQLGIQRLRVSASADACEMCSRLDGKVVAVNGNILSKGDSDRDSAGNIRYITKNYKHPPFHRGCLCGIVPED